jgi:hypothetical protein
MQLANLDEALLRPQPSSAKHSYYCLVNYKYD